MRLWALGQLETPPPESPPDAQDDGSELQQAAAAFGLLAMVPEPAPDAAPVFWLWPETVPYWQAWQLVQSRWVYAGGGMVGAVRVGLDLPAVETVLRAHGWRHSRQRSLQRALRALGDAEAAALQAWAELRARERSH